MMPHARPLRRAVVALALAGAAPTLLATGAAAQTILNTERFQLAEVDGFHMSADLSIDGQRGNKEILNAGTSGIVGVRTPRHWTRVVFGGRYLSDADRAILDSRYVQLRYSYLVSERTRTFHFVQAQRNETLRLRSRWLVGSGVRRTVASGEHTSFAVGTGLMGEWEEVSRDAVEAGAATSARALRMANLAVLSRDLDSGARVLNILYVQPDVGALSDVRVLNDLGILVPITERLRATLSAEWRHDSRPPAALGKNDLTFRMGLGIDVR